MRHLADVEQQAAALRVAAHGVGKFRVVGRVAVAVALQDGGAGGGAAQGVGGLAHGETGYQRQAGDFGLRVDIQDFEAV